MYDLNRQIDRYDMLWHAIGLEYSQSMQVNSDWIRGCLMSETTVTRCGNSSPNHVSPNHISLKTFHPIIGERTFHPILRFTQYYVSSKLRFTQLTFRPNYTYFRVSPNFCYSSCIHCTWLYCLTQLLDRLAWNFDWGNQENHGNLLRLVKKF